MSNKCGDSRARRECWSTGLPCSWRSDAYNSYLELPSIRQKSIQYIHRRLRYATTCTSLSGDTRGRTKLKVISCEPAEIWEATSRLTRSVSCPPGVCRPCLVGSSQGLPGRERASLRAEGKIWARERRPTVRSRRGRQRGCWASRPDFRTGWDTRLSAAAVNFPLGCSSSRCWSSSRL
jgi:hypothetical protein